MKFLAILTLQLPDIGAVASRYETVTVDSGGTRTDIFHYMRHQIAVNSKDSRWERGAVVFFSAEPDGLSLEEMFTSDSGPAGS